MSSKAISVGVPNVSLRVIASIFATFIPLFSVIPSSPQAEVTTSITPTTGTGNLDTTITPAGNLYNITGGTRPGSGPNLFHSFGNFSVGAGDIANFLNTPVNGSLPFTSNILGRVTGGNISNVFGTIQTTDFGNANLFLMNTAGFLFGPNATLNVGGIVSFTTADYLKLTDNVKFNAIPDATGDALLSSMPLAAFGFLGSNATSIAIQGGTLEVPESKSLSFIGGPRSFTTDTGATVPSGVTMTGGSLSAPNGLIYMATVTSPGEIPVPTISGAQLGPLGSPSSDSAVIRIRSGEFVMDHAFLTATNTSDAAQPAIDVNIQGTMVVRNASSIASQTLGAGHGSDVHIAAQSLLMDGSSIMSTTVGSGQGGAVSISGTDNASFTNSTINTSVSSANEASQNAGAIGVTALHLSMQDSQFLAEVTGNGDGTTAAGGGAVTLTGTNSVAVTRSKIATDTFASNGNGGAVSITAPTVTLEGSSTVINTIFTGAAGDGITPVAGSGGVVTLTATTGPLSVTNSSISTASNSAGSAGAVSLTGNSSLTLADSSIDSSTVFAIGNSGPVTFMTNGPLSMTDSTINTSSFFAGSAGAVSLTGNDSLTATNLSIDARTAFSFGDSGPVTLTTNGPLSMTNSKILTSAFQSGNAGSVTATGENVTLDGTDVTAEVSGDATVGLTMVQSGAVTLTATDTATGTVTVTNGSSISTQGFTTDLDNSPVTITGKTINILNGSAIDASMHNGNGDIISPANGGTIKIRGSTVNVAGSQLLSFGDGVPLSTGTGGNIHFVGSDGIQSADTIQLTASQVNVSQTAGGGGGSIEFQTKELTISNHTDVGTSSFGKGAGGTVTVMGAENVTIESGSRVVTDVVLGPTAFTQGSAGNILVETQQLTLRSGGLLSSKGDPLSTGDAGSITLQGQAGQGSHANSVLIDGSGSGIFTDTQGTGAGGNIFVNANSVTLKNGGTLSAATSGTALSATGGTITVEGNLVQINSAATITTATSGTGIAGDILVKAGTFNMSGRATITAASTGTGNAGNVNIQGLASPAQSVLIDGAGSGIFTETQGTGVGGNILIETSQSTTLTKGAAVSASSTGTMDSAGDAGMVTIHAGNTFFMQNSSVTTQATKSGGGQIEINAANLFRLINSKVSSSVLDGTGGGGNITIDPNVVVLQNSQILAQAIKGAGGNILITTPLFLADSTSLVSASSQFGLNGTVTIQSPTSNLSESLGPLTSKPSQTQSLLTQRCAALANGQASSFVVAGREQLPADPGGWLTSPLALAGIDTEGFGDGTLAEGTSNLEPRTSGLLANDTVSLRRLTPAGFLIANFADSEATGCHS